MTTKNPHQNAVCSVHVIKYLSMPREKFNQRTKFRTRLLVILFKRWRQGNTAMSANTAMPMFLASCETEMHIWKYGWEWTTSFQSSYFTQKQICKHSKSDVIRQYTLSESSTFFFYCSRYLSSHNYCPDKNNKQKRYRSDHNLGKDKLKN